MTGEEADAALDEARSLTSQGRYEEALSKTLLYHHGSVGTGHGGVRLSFALGDWLALAEKYPPALDALRRTRDEAREGVLMTTADRAAGTDAFEYFHDFGALNEALGEEHLTAELFFLVEAQDPKRAKRLYNVAEPALIKGGYFGRTNKYLDPESAWTSATESRRVMREFEGNRADPRIPKTADKFFAQEVTTLIALLAINGRKEEATVIAGRARATLPDPTFHAAVATALEGHVPEPWP